MPLSVSALAYGLGWVDGGTPYALSWIALVATGALIGVRFSGTTPSFLIESLKLGLTNLLIAGVISFAFAWTFATLVGLPLIQVWLAFSPGGLDTMTVLAFSLGVDPAFVAAHQLARFLGLNLAGPWLFSGARS